MAFIDRGLAHARLVNYFVTAWQQLKYYMLSVKLAWEQGQTQFQQDLNSAQSNPDDLGYLSQIDFVSDCYAYVGGRKLYPKSDISCRWFVNGYMLAWRKYFLIEEKKEVEP